MEQQLIQYVHDGSETLIDVFTVVANASEVNQQSQPRTVAVSVIPSNDEAPVLIVNQGLQVDIPWERWGGGVSFRKWLINKERLNRHLSQAAVMS